MTLCFIRRLLLIISVITAAAQQQRSNVYTPYYRIATLAKQSPPTGNGNTLEEAAIALENLSGIPASNIQNSVNWYDLWLRTAQKQQQQQQKQQLLMPNFRIQNVELPLEQQRQRQLINTNFNTRSYNSYDDDVVKCGYENDCGNDDDNNESLDSSEAVYRMVKRKPNPIYWSERYTDIGKTNERNVPQYPYAAVQVRNTVDDLDATPKPPLLRNFKRERARIKHQPAFVPSISAGALTNLGDFFRDLSKNIRFKEKSELGKAEQRLLDGVPPFGQNETNVVELLHAIRAYRPSQKIRSLVSMNPPGYHGSHLIDPNYMWVGMGK